VSGDSNAPRIFHIGGYSRGPNCVVRQMMLALSGAGYTVCEYNTDQHPDALETDRRAYDRGCGGPVWLKWELLENPISTFRPDVIICNAGGLSFRPDVSAGLRRRVRLVGIALSDPEVFEPAASRIARNFDRFLTNASYCLPRYRALGVNAMLLPVGTNHEFFHPVPARPDLACDVLFMGLPHPDRIEPIRTLCNSFHVHLYGERWAPHGIESRGTIYEDESLAALNSAKVSMIFSKTVSGHPNIKGGLFDFLAAGAFVVTDYQPELLDYFDIGREIVTYTSIPEMLEKIRYFLAHEAERSRIQTAGRQRVLRDHTWQKIWPRVLDGLI
jgi:spore maturation protein CgeB